MPDQIEKRKSDHIRICLNKDVQAHLVTTGFEDVFFVHKALPEINRDNIDVGTTVFDHEFSAPIIVEAMTGGTSESTKINISIAKAVEQLGIGMGVGSQRAAIENSKLLESFIVARENAPTAFLISNIGGPQILRRKGVERSVKTVEMINADALAIHLNPLQEIIQLEGETNYEGVVRKIGEIVEAVDVPVIIKETGAGIAYEVAKMLENSGVTAIDIAGAGGTSWAAVEYYRAKKIQDEVRQRLGKTFWDWGVHTVASLIEVVQTTSLTVIASGGVRSGMDVAKTLTLGANLSGIALPILRQALKGPGAVEKTLRFIIEEIKNTMFLIGAESINKLKSAPVVILGKTAEWLRTRGFHPEVYARR
jgi:isopentenyl-diphosphate delta-isomerase